MTIAHGPWPPPDTGTPALAFETPAWGDPLDENKTKQGTANSPDENPAYQRTSTR